MSNQVYNNVMTRHFSRMTRNEQAAFNHDMKVLTGMLYSIVTLRAFFPSRSPAKKADLAGGPAPYPIPLEKAGDK